MNKQMLSFSPLKTAKVFAALYFALSLPLLLSMVLPMLASPASRPPYFFGFMFAMPFMYALIGFMFTLLGTWIYHLVVGQVSGLECTTGDVTQA
jgi:hypothetical protein